MPISRELPKVYFILVQSSEMSGSRTIEGQAISTQSLNQNGIQFTLMDFQQVAGITLEMLSERRIQTSAISELDDASLDLIASNVSFVASQLLSGATSDAFILSARDLISLGVFSSAEALADVRTTTGVLANSSLLDTDGNNLLTLQANNQLTFIGLGDSTRASLAFDLLTQVMRDSSLNLGNGDDVVTITSGFRGDTGTIGDAASAAGGGSGSTVAGGIHFNFNDKVSALAAANAWSLRLNATAIGLQDSSIDTGAGNDQVIISTQIDERLADDLGILYGDPGTIIQLQRIGMLRSTLSMGSGDDLVSINGSVIDSTIDLGAGNNTLLIEGSFSGNSRILSGQGQNRIVISSGLSGAVMGGDGDDAFDLSTFSQAGRLDGGAGMDRLTSAATDQRDLALIQGRDQGFLGGLQFKAIEELDLGSGNDVALLSLEGSLSGLLLGGEGLDRLEFSNWELPVAVDLDLGSATAIRGGARGGIQGFEQVLGGTGNDVLSGSSLAAGLDGNLGDDVLFLRWAPWLSPAAEGTDLHGGEGRDLFVLSGLEGPVPLGWNQLYGVPTFKDLELDVAGTNTASDSLGWLRQTTTPDGSSQEFISLTPSGLEGLGNVRLLPIAPLEQLLSGMVSGTRQLAIAWDPLQGDANAELRLLGAEGPGTSRLIATLPSDVLIPERNASAG